ncbi:MAG: cytochrome c oxidase subunit II [Gemmataceae bacterium]|nr:cytochrome c oxidase subunit II [Gemmataceae bacterium]
MTMDTGFRLLPEQASTMAPRVDGLFWFISGVSIFFALGIGLAVIVFAIRYRRRSEDYFPEPVVGSTPLELTWTIIPLILALVMFFWGVRIYFDYARMPASATEVYVVGRQWMWHLQHPGGQREINTLHVPVGQPVKLIMTSEDVIHDFYVPAFRVKRDAVPGKYTTMWFEATKTGTYPFYCAMYCGTEHSRMIGTVVVMEQAEYERWLERNADRSMALQGRQLFQKLQCVTCHHPEAGNRAPILENLYGKRVMTDRGEALADEAYLRESIRIPDRKVRAGWQPIMPPYDAATVPEQDMAKLLAFLKSLKTGGTPPLVQQSDPPERPLAEPKKAPKDEKK